MRTSRSLTVSRSIRLGGGGSAQPPPGCTTLRLAGSTHLWEPPHWVWLVLLISRATTLSLTSPTHLESYTLRFMGPTYLWEPPCWGWQALLTSESHHIKVDWSLLTSESHHIEVNWSYLAETLCRYRCYFRIRRSVQSYQLWHQLHQNALLVYNQQWNRQCHGNRSLK